MRIPVLMTVILIIVFGLIYFFFGSKTKTPQPLRHPEWIEQINSFEQALPRLDTADSQALILFDVDDVLVDMTDIMARHYALPWTFRLKAAFFYPQLLRKKNFEHYFSILVEQGGWYVIEPEVITIINDLKQRGYTVLALTSMETGSFGRIESFPQWRFDVLKKLGIELSRNYDDAVFNNLPSYRDHYPELYKGIICCNRQPKGVVLGAFLDRYQVHPSHIIFFDDSAKNLDSVAIICEQRGIPFHGFEYTRGKEQTTGKWDGARAWKQLKHLMEKEEWLADTAA